MTEVNSETTTPLEPSVEPTSQINIVKQSESVALEDLDMPKSIVNRLIKTALPDGINVKNDARIALIKACTIFINFVTATANDISRKANLKTIAVPHVTKALETLEFNQLVPEVLEGLQQYKEFTKNRKKKKSEEASHIINDDEERDELFEMMEKDDAEDDLVERKRKREEDNTTVVKKVVTASITDEPIKDHNMEDQEILGAFET